MKSETNTGFHVCGSGCQNKLRCGFSMAWWEGCRSTGCVWNFKFCSSIIEGNIQLDYLGMSAQIPEVKLWINALFSVEFSAPNWNTELHMGSHLRMAFSYWWPHLSLFVWVIFMQMFSNVYQNYSARVRKQNDYYACVPCYKISRLAVNISIPLMPPLLPLCSLCSSWQGFYWIHQRDTYQSTISDNKYLGVKWIKSW